MVGILADYGLQYSGYLLEVGLILLLAWRGQAKRLTSLCLYLVCLVGAEASRSNVLNTYGLASRQYFYCFYVTDFLLVLAFFLLVCAFFKRACIQEEKMWRFARLLLFFVFVLVAGVSSFSLFRNYSQLAGPFIVEFEQNLYFTCLVLNTLLYILMQQIESADDELSLLVCGAGIQLAGPAATMALVYLTPGQHYSKWLLDHIMPLCTLGMLLTWAYAIVRPPQAGTASARRKISAVAEAATSNS
jgi:hypothetical protein